MQTTAYVSSSPARLAAGVSVDALEALIEEFNDDTYSVALEFDGDNNYRFEMETMDVYQESISEALDKLCEAVGPLLAAPVEVLLRVDEMNDDRDRFFYATPDASALDAFMANCRIERAIECLGLQDIAAREALQKFLVVPPSPELHERPRA